MNTTGNRKLNQVIHIVAVTQVRSAGSAGQMYYYRRKLTEGKTEKEAMRALKRRISDAIYRRQDAEACGVRVGKRGRLLRPA